MPATATIGAVTGELIKEDGSALNVADVLAAVYDVGTGKIKTDASLVGDVTIGNLTLKDGATADTAKVVASTSVAEGDKALATKDASLGLTTDAAVTDPTAAASSIAVLKGLLTILGAKTGAAVVTDAAGTAQQYLRGLVKIFADVWDSANHFFKVQVQAGEAHLGEVADRIVTVAAAEVVRPANATAYTAKDAVAASTNASDNAALLKFANVARLNGGSGTAVKLRATTDDPTCTAQLKLHFFTVAQPTVAIPGDNVPMLLAYGNDAQYLGSLVLPAFATEDAATSTGATAELKGSAAALDFVCDVAARDIFYRAETVGAFTPASGQKFRFELTAKAN